MSENNISKKLKKGFTLIELIVVMAIMGFLFVAILNLMDPIQNVYHTAVGTQDTAETIEGVMTYADNQLRFASNVCVLKDFDGVPRVEGKSLFINGVKQSVEYDNVLILDNNNDRSKSNNEVAKRKGATGAVLRTDLASGLDLDNANLAPTNDYYGEVRYEFDTEVNYSDADTSKVYIDLGVTAFGYHLEDTTYVFDQKLQSYARRIELVNIGINKSDQYKLDDYAVGGVSNAITSGTYDSVGADKQKRTYIFYRNPTVSDSTEKQCKIILQYYVTDNTYSGQSTFTVKLGNTPKVFDPGLSSVVVGDKIYTPSGEWKDSSGTEYKISDINNTVVTDDMTFQAIYTEATKKTVTVDGVSYDASLSGTISFNEDTYKDLTGSDVPEDKYISGYNCTYTGDPNTYFYPFDNPPTVTDELVSVEVVFVDKLTGHFELTMPGGDKKTKDVKFIPGSPAVPENDDEFTTSVEGYLFAGWKVGEDTYEEWASAHGDSDFDAVGSFVKDSADTTVKMIVHVSEESRSYSGKIRAVSVGNNVSSITVNGNKVYDGAWSNSTVEAYGITLNEETVTIEVVKPNNKQTLEAAFIDNANNECIKVEPTAVDGTTVEKWLYNNVFYDTEYDMLTMKKALPSVAFTKDTPGIEYGERAQNIKYTVENNGVKSFKPYLRFIFADDIEYVRKDWQVYSNNGGNSGSDFISGTEEGKSNVFSCNLPDIAPGTVLNDGISFFVRSKNNPDDPNSISLQHVYIYYLDGDGNEVALFDEDV